MLSNEVLNSFQRFKRLRNLSEKNGNDSFSSKKLIKIARNLSNGRTAFKHCNSLRKIDSPCVQVKLKVATNICNYHLDLEDVSEEKNKPAAAREHVIKSKERCRVVVRGVGKLNFAERKKKYLKIMYSDNEKKDEEIKEKIKSENGDENHASNVRKKCLSMKEISLSLIEGEEDGERDGIFSAGSGNVQYLNLSSKYPFSQPDRRVKVSKMINIQKVEPEKISEEERKKEIDKIMNVCTKACAASNEELKSEEFSNLFKQLVECTLPNDILLKLIFQVRNKVSDLVSTLKNDSKDKDGIKTRIVEDCIKKDEIKDLLGKHSKPDNDEKVYQFGGFFQKKAVKVKSFPSVSEIKLRKERREGVLNFLSQLQNGVSPKKIEKKKKNKKIQKGLMVRKLEKKVNTLYFLDEMEKLPKNRRDSEYFISKLHRARDRVQIRKKFCKKEKQFSCMKKQLSHPFILALGKGCKKHITKKNKTDFKSLKMEKFDIKSNSSCTNDYVFKVKNGKMVSSKLKNEMITKQKYHFTPKKSNFKSVLVKKFKKRKRKLKKKKKSLENCLLSWNVDEAVEGWT